MSRKVRRLLAAAVLAWGVLAAARVATAADGERVLPPRGTSGVVYVALGDSTVEGIGASSPDRNYPSRIAARLREIYPDATLHNLGVAGAVASDVVGSSSAGLRHDRRS